VKKILLLFFILITTTFGKTDTLESVSIALKWKHQFQFAGYYAALHKGFYEDEGLDVTLVPRNHDTNQIKDVIANKYEYGIADSVLMLYMTRGEDVVIVAPIFQQSPNVIMTLKQSGIETPYDLNAKRVLFYNDDADGSGILAMTHGLGVQPVFQRTKPYDDISALINKEVDAYTGYITNEPYELMQQGYEVNIIDPAHYGLNLYGDMLFTNSVEASKNPERVERVKRATIKGWKYALEHPKEITQLIIEKYNSEKSEAHLLYEAQALSQLVRHKTIPLGTLDRGRFMYNIELYHRYGLINSSVPIDKHIFQPPTQNEKKENNDKTFTKAELEYLAKKAHINVCIDPNWMPFEGFVDGIYTGMAADYFEIFQSFLPVKLKVQKVDTWSESIELLKQRKCDIASLVMPTQSRREYLSFTKPYLITPMVVVTKIEKLFISDPSELVGKNLGIVKDYAFKEILSKRNPDIILRDVDSAREGLDMVLNDELDGFVGTLATTGYIIQKDYIGQLKIAGKFNENWSLGVGVRNDEPILKDIFEKLVDKVSFEKAQEIQNRWLSIVYEKDNGKDILKWLAISSSVFTVIILIVLFTNKKLRSEIKERKVAQSLLHTASITDELTSLYNRRHFNTIVNRMLKEAKHDNEMISFAIMDVDFFKQYNDNYGHKAGDEALRQVAEVLKKSLYRSGDFCFRLGGEEFGILFKGENAQNSKKIFERIANNIKALKIKHSFGATDGMLTVSFGVVSIKANLVNDIDTLYKTADDMLYEAKKTGRDKICFKEVI
jgi:diguanylate cyclase (GGDEF)-like protein